MITRVGTVRSSMRHSMRLPSRISILLLSLVLLPTVPLLAFIGYTAWGYARAQIEATDTRITRQAEALASQLHDRIDHMQGLAAGLALTDAALGADIPALYRQAQRVVATNPGVAAVTLVAPDGRLVFTTVVPLGSPMPVLEVDPTRAVFQTGKPVLSGPFRPAYALRNLTVVALGVPVWRRGQVAYCLRVSFSTDYLSEVLHSTVNLPGWLAATFDPQGVMTSRSRDPDTFVGRTGTPAFLAAIDRGETGIFEVPNFEGERVRTVMRTIEPWDWHLALGVESRRLVAPVQRELIMLSLIALLVLSLAGLAVVHLSRRITRGLRETVEASQAVLAGYPAPVDTAGILEIEQMRDSLTRIDALSRLLEERVASRTAELAAERARLERFTTEREAAIEAERLRIAREVHDEIGSIFTGVTLLIRGRPDAGMTPAERSEILAALEGGLAAVRRVVAELRPPLIDDIGLPQAIEAMMRSALGPAGVASEVELRDTELLSPDQLIGCYRIAQEAITNVLRHARATRCRVEGASTPDDTWILSVVDDGVGLPADEGGTPGHFGLVGMQERARLMNGCLTIRRGEHGGTRVELVLPLGHDETGPVEDSSGGGA
jgi:signal transduction histidine kinase